MSMADKSVRVGEPMGPAKQHEMNLRGRELQRCTIAKLKVSKKKRNMEARAASFP